MSAYQSKPSPRISPINEGTFVQRWSERRPSRMPKLCLPSPCAICHEQDVSYYKILSNHGSPIVVHIRCEMDVWFLPSKGDIE